MIRGNFESRLSVVIRIFDSSVDSINYGGFELMLVYRSVLFMGYVV